MFPFRIKLFIFTILSTKISSYKHLFLYIIKPGMTNLWQNKKIIIPRFIQNPWFYAVFNFSPIGRYHQVRMKAISCRFDPCYPHQTVEIRTLYQSVKGSDFYYILIVQTLIINLKYTNIEISGDKILIGFISFSIYFYPHIRQNKCLLIKWRYQI